MVKSEKTLGLIITLISLSTAVNLLEYFIPFPIPIPGGKWGFSNSFVLYAIVNGGLIMGLTIAIGKSVLSAILSGRLFSLPFVLGMSGITVSVMIMHITLWITRKRGIGYVGLSILGAFASNLTQLSILVLFLKNRFIIYQLPYFSLLGSISAVVNAFIAYELGRKKG